MISKHAKLTAFAGLLAFAASARGACFPNPLAKVDSIVCIPAVSSSTVPVGGITGAAANSILFANASAVVGTSANLQFQSATQTFIVGSDQYTLSTGSNITQMTMKGGSAQGTSTYIFWRDPSNNLLSIIDAQGAFASYASGVQKIWHGTNILLMSSDSGLSWLNNTAATAGTVDVRLLRDSAGWLKVTDVGGSNLANLKVGQLQIGTSGPASIDFALSASTPAAPPAGSFSLWADNADSRFKTQNSSGTVTVLVDRTSTETLTNKTLTSPTINGGTFSGALSSATVTGGTNGRCVQTNGTTGAIETAAAACGSGGSSFNALVCVLPMNCVPHSTDLANSAVAAVANRVYIMPISLFAGHVANSWMLYASAGGSTTDAVNIGLYADSSGSAGAKLTEANFVDFTASAPKTSAVTGAPYTLTPGRYWLAWAAQNTAMQSRMFPSSTSGFGMMITAGVTYRCANTATGGGATYALPATCGSMTAEATFAIPAVISK